MRSILYVDRDVTSLATVAFADGLRALGEVYLMKSLSWEVVEAVHQSLNSRPFDAVVSHLPFSLTSHPVAGRPFGQASAVWLETATYSSPFALLGKIKLIADIPIIVYTGANFDDVPVVPWELSGVDNVFHKSMDREKDVQFVVRMIRRAWKRYASLPSSAEVCCENDASSFWIETVVRLNWGLGMYAASRIVGILQGLEGVIELLDDKGSVAGKCELNGILDMLKVSISCGSRIRIRVSSTVPKVKIVLYQVHHLLNLRYLNRA